jgi:cation:H+ antiporter
VRLISEGENTWMGRPPVQLACIICLSIVAAGTSLPQLATSVAAMSGERDAAASLLRLGIPLMVALACLAIVAAVHLSARREGALPLGCYRVYVLYLILATTQHAALSLFSTAMLRFVLLLTLIVLLMRHRTLTAVVKP